MDYADLETRLLETARDHDNEFRGTAMILREAASVIASFRALLSAVIDVETVEPTGDPHDPTSWTSAASSVVAGSEHERVREELRQAQDAIAALAYERDAYRREIERLTGTQPTDISTAPAASDSDRKDK